MIRHSKSFFASILVHSILLILIFVAWQNWPEKKKEEEKKVCLKMCYVQEPKIIPKKIEPKLEKPKVILPPPPPPPPPKKIKKPKPKKKPKKKIVKKKIKPKVKKKTVPVIKKAPKKLVEPEIIEKKIEPKIIPIVIEEVPEVVVQKVPVESQAQKAKRLEKDYLSQHIREIRKLIRNNLYYPRSARKRGVTGKVMVKFKLLTNGNIEYIKVSSSKSEILSRAATKTIEDLSGDFPKPKEDLTLHVPINYTLNQR